MDAVPSLSLPRVLSSSDELPHCITGVEYAGKINVALEKYLYSLLMIHRCRMSVRRMRSAVIVNFEATRRIDEKADEIFL